MNYRILDWDSHFFGIKVARILSASLTLKELKQTLADLKRERVKLVYWPAEKELAGDEEQNLGACLVDRKTTFEVNLKMMDPGHFHSTGLVEKYRPSMSMKEIESLAIQSGEYSRFSVDQNVERERFESLYKNWIRKSLSREIAEEVLFIQDADKLAGMVTLGNKEGKGDIGLLAVESKYRGKKYGETLVRAAQTWFINNGYEIGHVVTQGKNLPACNLYKKCEYSVSKVEYFYHFWL